MTNQSINLKSICTLWVWWKSVGSLKSLGYCPRKSRLIPAVMLPETWNSQNYTFYRFLHFFSIDNVKRKMLLPNLCSICALAIKSFIIRSCSRLSWATRPFAPTNTALMQIDVQSTRCRLMVSVIIAAPCFFLSTKPEWKPQVPPFSYLSNLQCSAGWSTPSPAPFTDTHILTGHGESNYLPTSHLCSWRALLKWLASEMHTDIYFSFMCATLIPTNSHF